MKNEQQFGRFSSEARARVHCCDSSSWPERFRCLALPKRNSNIRLRISECGRSC